MFLKIHKFYENLSVMHPYFNIGLKELDKHFNLQKYADNYSFVDPIPTLLKSETADGKIGPMVTIFQKMSIALRAQLVRHRNFSFKDNLIEIEIREELIIDLYLLKPKHEKLKKET